MMKNIGLSLIACLPMVGLSGCGPVHTRIGWPGFYWQHGATASLGFLVVLLLVEVSVTAMWSSLRRDRRGDFYGVKYVPWSSPWGDPERPMRVLIPKVTDLPSSERMNRRLLGMSLPLVAAFVLLQFLPDSRSGVQLLPCSPWAFKGWVPFLISILGWSLIGVAVPVVLSCPLDRDVAVAFFGLSLLVLTILLSFWEADVGGEQSMTPPVSAVGSVERMSFRHPIQQPPLTTTEI